MGLAVELHQLELRYEALRTRSAGRERRLLASIAEAGQQTPIIVVREGERWVVVDGYKRARVMRRLGHDMIAATAWELSEADALVLERVLRAGEADSAIEQGWFLRELLERFGLSLEELARRFDRTKSWVSRRLALVRELPAAVQQHVRAGDIGAHAAMKYLVPLARANASDCTQLCEALAPQRPSSREVGELYAAWTAGSAQARQLVVSAPQAVLRAREQARRDGQLERGGVELVLDDLRIAGAVSRRAYSRIKRGALLEAPLDERERVRRACVEAHAELETVRARCEKEVADARREHASGDPAAA